LFHEKDKHRLVQTLAWRQPSIIVLSGKIAKRFRCAKNKVENYINKVWTIPQYAQEFPTTSGSGDIRFTGIENTTRRSLMCEFVSESGYMLLIKLINYILVRPMQFSLDKHN